MGATNIHYEAIKKHYKSALEAFKELVENDLYEYGHDPYSGTIATCSLSGKISRPKDDDAYEEALDRIGKRECVYYETDNDYIFIGWAAC